MKNKIIPVITICLLLFICSCGSKNESYMKIEKDYRTYTDNTSIVDTNLSSDSFSVIDSNNESNDTANFETSIEESALNQQKYYEGVSFETFFDMSGAGKKESNPNRYMAHNIYANPYLGNTMGKYNDF